MDGVSRDAINRPSSFLHDLTGLGDINDDGFDDIGISSHENLYVFLGTDTLTKDTLQVESLIGANGFRVKAVESLTADPAGDFNGDGLSDVFLTQFSNSNGAIRTGYVLSGSTTPFTSEFFIGTNEFLESSFNVNGFEARFAVGIGDENNDGFDDLLLSDPLYNVNATNDSSRVIVLYGRATDQDLNNNFIDIPSLPDSEFFPIFNSDIIGEGYLGFPVTALDFNGDGTQNLVIGEIDSIAFSAPFPPGQLHILGLAEPNNPPTDITLSMSTITENEAVGTIIETLSTLDSDAMDTHTYTLGGADEASFSIDDNTLESAIVFDFEVKSSYSINIMTDDGNGGSFVKAFTISIQDVDENVLGLAEQIQPMIYPNPTEGKVSIIGGYLSAELFSIDGQLIKKISSSIEEIDISKLARGSYILRLNSNENAVVSRVIIKR